MKAYEMEYADHYYFSSMPVRGIGGLWPLRAGRNIAKENYHIGPRFIECYSFHFVMEGKVRFKHAGHQVELQKGDLYCLFPHIVYEYDSLPSNEPLSMRWIAFTNQQAKHIVDSLGMDAQQSYMRMTNYHDLHMTLEHIFTLLDGFNDKKLEHVTQLQSRLYELINRLLVQANNTISESASDWLQRSKDYMEKHFTEGITVEDVVTYIGVHRSYFSERFSRRFGIPPMKYLQQLRLEKGKDMLRTTDFTVTEIALSLGYPTLYAFTRAFRNCFDIPPTEYRVRAKMNNLV
ncbi:AraC family transcriptional regulator [Radiobacillus sp. PE A8.2]|uniref:helix-turn-helix transcriptional regulator n=1 Tax=Radiobacillus sp. PE A8.2 TaxID=3380349 RepID=UPI00388F6205